ncbi:MAG: HlyD family efflux transporter periplasmic adaptor subunit, partial [Propionibacteriaceae bacterium]|nr:HlyD family efflux transporter periplasmic adaptor subunit [Propionibacteriaceae bacterium]
VHAGQSLATLDTSAHKAQLAAAKADAAVAAAQVGLLGDAIDTTYDKQSDVEDAKAEVSDAIDKLHDGRRQLLRARATIRKNLPLARQGLAQVEAAIAGIPPGVPVPEELLAKQQELTAAIKGMKAGLRKIAATLPKLSRGLRKATAGLRKLEDALADISEARGTLRDLKELAALRAEAMQVPIDVVRVQLGLAVLTSPVDGVVVAAASPGAVLAPGATAVSIRETGASRVTAWLSAGQLARVCKGDPASVTGDWLPAGGVAARLTHLGTRADYPPTSVATEEVHLTRAVEVELTATEQLPAGMPVELNIDSCRPAAGNPDTDR